MACWGRGLLEINCWPKPETEFWKILTGDSWYSWVPWLPWVSRLPWLSLLFCMSWHTGLSYLGVMASLGFMTVLCIVVDLGVIMAVREDTAGL